MLNVKRALEAVAYMHDITVEELTTASGIPERIRARAELCYVLYWQLGASMADTSRAAGFAHYTGASVHVRNHVIRKFKLSEGAARAVLTREHMRRRFLGSYKAMEAAE